jgi:hypothetical protein
MSAFGIGGWLFVSIVTIQRIVLLAVDRQHPDSRLAHFLRGRKSLASHKNAGLTAGFPWPFLITTLVTLLSVTQIWAYFRIQNLQAQMTKAAGNSYLDQQWTFGQVVAVSVFAPVLTEALFFMRHQKVLVR